MTTGSVLITQAFRELNLIPEGGTLTTGQVNEALLLLDRFLFSLFGFELGEFNTPWPVPPATTSPVDARYPLLPEKTSLPSTVWPYPPSNVVILMSLTEDTTIYLPATPDDGARMSFVNLVGAVTYTLTVDGNGRLVQGASTLLGTPATLAQVSLLYRADLGDWIDLTNILSGTQSPLPYAYDTLLILGTAERLAARYGRSLSAAQERDYARYLKRLKTQFRQSSAVPSASPQPFLNPETAYPQYLGLGVLG